jgi:hypothetical protein
VPVFALQRNQFLIDEPSHRVSQYLELLRQIEVHRIPFFTSLFRFRITRKSQAMKQASRSVFAESRRKRQVGFDKLPASPTLTAQVKIIHAGCAIIAGNLPRNSSHFLFSRRT